MLVQEKTSSYFAVELSLKEISYVMCCAHAHLPALMMRKLCAAGRRNVILRNHLKKIQMASGEHFVNFPASWNLSFTRLAPHSIDSVYT